MENKLTSGKVGIHPLKHPNFRRLCLGSIISVWGDQLTLISLPWLVIFLSPEPWVLGLVLSLIGIPMSAFILIGGSIVDKFSSKSVLLVCKISNCFLLFFMSLFLFLDLLTIPILCFISFLIGISSAFSIPAGTSFLPELLKPAQLQLGNSVIVSLRSAMSLIGPLSAGLLLGLTNSTSTNLSLIFLLDGLSFLISGLLLIKIKVNAIKRDRLITIKQSIMDAFTFFWRHKNLRTIVFYVAGIGFFIAGPVNVALPFFIKIQLNEGPSVLGYLLSAEAFGIIAGVALAGKFHQIGKFSLGHCVLFADFIAGLCLILLSFIPSFPLGLVLLFIMGVLTGFVQISLITWIQLQVSKEMLGRLMSIVMFTIIGLAPISTALCGYILSYIEASLIFMLSGFSLMIISVSALFFTKLSSIRKFKELNSV